MGKYYRSTKHRDNRTQVVAVDARVLSEIGKGVPRFLRETLQNLSDHSDIKFILMTNRPLHPELNLPFEIIIDRAWAYVPGTVWMMLRLNRLALKAGADTLWGPANFLPPKHKNLSTLLTVHDLVYHIMPKSMSAWNRIVSRVLGDASIRRANRVIADSQSTKNDIIAYVSKVDCDISVVYLGSNTALNLSTQKKQRERNFHTEDYLFCLGSIEPRKNIQGLLACFRIMQNDFPNLKLRFAGAHSWKSRDTYAEFERITNCEHIGYQTDEQITAHLSGARGFVMPSHYEGFGLPIIEAVGLAPIIASDIPVFRELGKYIYGICYVDFKNSTKAAEQIKLWLANSPPPATYRPGAEGLFSWQKTAEGYAQAFSLLRKK